MGSDRYIIFGIIAGVVAVGAFAIAFYPTEPPAGVDDEPSEIMDETEQSQTKDELETFQDPPSGHLISFSEGNEFYENWCYENDGVWKENEFLNEGSCHFETSSKLELATISLEEIKNTKVSGVAAHKICIILDIPCPGNPVFEANYDPVSDTTTMTYVKNELPYDFKINGTEVQYREPSEPQIWKLFEESSESAEDENIPILVDTDSGNDSLTVSTMKPFYFLGDELQIHGKVTDSIREYHGFSEIPVILQVVKATDLVEIAQVQLDEDGKFTHSFQAMGPQWQQDGTYMIKAFYGSSDIAQTSFKFSAS